MREISIRPTYEDDYSEKLSTAIAKAIAEAIKSIKPPIIHNQTPQIIMPEQRLPEKDRGSYMVTVNRDAHGRISTMVVSPYEPI